MKIDNLLVGLYCDFETVLLKVLHICFLIWSIRRGDSQKIPRPSSLYKPTLVLMVSGSWHSRYDLSLLTL